MIKQSLSFSYRIKHLECFSDLVFSIDFINLPKKGNCPFISNKISIKSILYLNIMFKKFGKMKFPLDPISTSIIRSYKDNIHYIVLYIDSEIVDSGTQRFVISRPTVLLRR